jgi:hypothetical protein
MTKLEGMTNDLMTMVAGGSFVLRGFVIDSSFVIGASSFFLRSLAFSEWTMRRITLERCSRGKTRSFEKLANSKL